MTAIGRFQPLMILSASGKPDLEDLTLATQFPLL